MLFQANHQLLLSHSKNRDTPIYAQKSSYCRKAFGLLIVIVASMKLQITPSLNGALGEAYYKEACDQKGWAYISLENIHNDISSQFKDSKILVFKKGFNRIRIKIPEQFISEIKEISRPTNASIENRSFVFDYLACRVGQKESYDGVMLASTSDL